MKRYKLEIIDSMSEAQNHRCAVCQSELILDKACFYRIVDENRKFGYHNSILICHHCSSSGSDIHELYSQFLEGQHPAHLITQRKLFPENKAIFREIMTERGFHSEVILYPTDIALIDPDTLRQLYKHKKPRLKSIGSPRATREIKNYLFRHQDGICCYDQYPMHKPSSGISGYLDPRCPTFEHLIERSKGGSNYIDNLKLACSVCNTMRSDYKMTPDEFRTWSNENKHIIEQQAIEIRKYKGNRPRLNMRPDETGQFVAVIWRGRNHPSPYGPYTVLAEKPVSSKEDGTSWYKDWLETEYQGWEVEHEEA
jgi:hypothetical protein